MKSTAIARSFAPLMALGLILSGAGCSSFNRDWKAAAAGSPDGITGAWVGSWKSDRNGHTGELRAVLTQRTASVYEARFRATFWKIFSGGYTVHLTAFPHDGAHSVSGTADLGNFLFWPLGDYFCSGKATLESVSARYTNRYDFGVFELKRPEPASQ
jgi:hypothetical protein